MPLAIDGTGQSSTATVTLTTANAGDLIVLLAGIVSGGAYTTSVVGGSLTWTKAVTKFDPSGGREIEVWTAPSAGALTGTAITLTYLTGGSNISSTFTVAFGVTGADISGLDATGTGSVNGSSSNPSMSISTSNANDMLIGAVVAQGTGPITAGSGFTLVIPSGSEPVGPVTDGEYQVVSSIQTGTTIGFTLSTSSWAMATIAIKAASTGVSGSMATTFGDFTLAGTASSQAAGAMAATFADFTLSGTGSVEAAGSAAVTFADFSMVGAAGVVAAGSMAVTFDDFALAGTATVSGGTATASLAVTFGDFTLAGRAEVDVAGAMTVTFADFTMAGAAQAEQPPLVWGPAPRFQVYAGMGSGWPAQVIDPSTLGPDPLFGTKVLAVALGFLAACYLAVRK